MDKEIGIKYPKEYFLVQIIPNFFLQNKFVSDGSIILVKI